MKIYFSSEKKLIQFEKCEYGDVLKIEDERQYWYGMKVIDEEGKNYILDLEEGKLYEDVKNYNIVSVVNCKLVLD